MQRSGQDGDTLSASGGVGGGHRDIARASVKVLHEYEARQRQLLGQVPGADPGEEDFRVARHLVRPQMIGSPPLTWPQLPPI